MLWRVDLYCPASLPPFLGRDGNKGNIMKQIVFVCLFVFNYKEEEEAEEEE